MAPIIRVQGVSGLEAYSDKYSFVVTLSEESLSDVVVQYRTIDDGSAGGRSDYSESFGTLVFQPGETRATVDIGHLSDSWDESDENYTLELHSPENAEFEGGARTLRATGVVRDNDGTANDLALFVSDPKVVEGDGGARQVAFELRLSQPAASTITFDYGTVDGSAVAGADYLATSGSLQFSPGQTVQTVYVPLIGDTAVETDEFFSLVVAPNASVRNGVADSTGVAIIQDDDTRTNLPVISIEGIDGPEVYSGPARFAVTLSEPSLSDVTVLVRTIADGSALAGIDMNEVYSSLTFAPGETQKYVEVTHSSDSVDDSDENYTVELYSPTNGVLAGDEPTLRATGVIFDQDGAANDLALFVSDPEIVEGDSGTKQAVFEVRLSAPSAQEIVLDYATRDGSAQAGQDYIAAAGQVTFAAGQTKTVVRVDVIGDTLVEDAENFSLVVTPTGQVRNGVADSTGIARIVDTDTRSGLPVISFEGVTSSEAYSAKSAFNISLSEASLSDVTVFYRTVEDGSALSGIDYDRTSGSVTFTPGQTTAQIWVHHASDSPDESDENYSVELYAAENAVLAGGEASLRKTGIILDRDGASNDLALFVSDPQIAEGDTGRKQAVFEIRLSQPATREIVLPFQTVDGTATAGQDYIATSGEIRFLPGQTTTSVRVDVLGDSAIESAETFSLVVTPNGLIENGTEDSTGEATIFDDDTRSDLPVISVVGATAAETYSGSAYFKLTLSEPVLSQVTVDYMLRPDGSATRDVDFGDTAGTVTFAAGQTVAFISARHYSDAPDESDENYSIRLHSPTNAVLAGGEASLLARGEIHDQDGAANDLALFVSDPLIAEGDDGRKTAVFTIELSQPAAAEVTLDYTTIDGTATAGQDYITTFGAVTFLAGQTTATVGVEILGDRVAETDETFSLVVTPDGRIQNGTEDSTGMATIKDEDSSVGLPVLSIEPATDVEGYSTKAGFIVTLSKPSNEEITVRYTTREDGSATAGTDFRLTPDVLTFAAGETQKLILVEHLSDSPDESDENYSVVLFDPQNAVLAGEMETLAATGVILDQDGTANDLALFVSDPEIVEGNGGVRQVTFELTLSRPAANDITLAYQTMDGSALAGSDYQSTSGTVTFLAGQTLATVRVNVLGDTVEELSETFSLVVTPNGFIRNGTQDSTGIATIISNESFGGDGDNTLIGSGIDDFIDGRSGNDRIEGRGGNDQLLGNAGNDVVLGGDGNDSIFGGLGNDFLAGGSGNDLIVDGAGLNEIYGGAGSDEIRGGIAADIIFGGGNGTNVILGNDGNDAITAGDGGDFIGGGGGSDRIIGGFGNDTIYTGDGDDTVASVAGDDLIVASAGTNRLLGGYGSDTIYGGSGADEIRGEGSGSNELSGRGGDDLIVAGSGNDVMAGGAANDRIYGGAGNNTIYLGTGNDFVGGGAGNDVIFGGAGANTIYAGAGADTVNGGVDGELIFGGGTQGDVLLGNGGNDSITGASGGDVLAGGEGNDTVLGGDGADVLYLGTGTDLAGGGAGNDAIVAGAGANTIFGGTGNDTIYAGVGRDVMNGGPGQEHFVFNSAAQAGIGAGRDVITDFDAGVDRINLDILDLTFRGAGAFTGTGTGEVRYIPGFVVGDVDGDGQADFAIEVVGAPVLGADDFIL